MTTYWHEFPTDISSLGAFLQWVNGIMYGQLGLLILISTWMISFLSLKNNSSSKAMGASSFVTLLIGVFLYRIELISEIYALILIVILVVSIVMVRTESEKLGL